MTATTHVVGLIALAACVTASGPPAVANQDRGAERAVLVRSAEAALARETAARDLRRTSLSPPIDRRDTAERFLAACRAGDHRSCWIAYEIGGPGTRALSKIRANCESGDQLSCRALPTTTDAAEPHELERGCAAGYPASCFRMIIHAPSQPEITNRMVELVRTGCAAGITGECELIFKTIYDRDPRDELLAARQLCAIALRHCYFLGGVEKGDVIKRRDAFEHACQYGLDDDAKGACEELLDAYFFHDYPEPVPGRWMALEAWQCQTLGTTDQCLRRLRREYGGPLAPPPPPPPGRCDIWMRPSNYCPRRRSTTWRRSRCGSRRAACRRYVDLATLSPWR